MRFAWLSVLLLGAWFAALAPRVTADGFIIVHDGNWRPPRLPRHGLAPSPQAHVFAPLEVSYHHVDVRIREQVAVTHVDEEFYNPNDAQLEGTYVFPIPKGATLDKFSMRIGDKDVEGELLPAAKAREIYENIVREMRDPALLEYAGRDAFKVRIFPIEPRGHKRIQLTYTQLLRQDHGLVSYAYPLNTEKFSAKPLGDVRVTVTVDATRPLTTIYSPSHTVELTRPEPKRAIARYQARGVKPDTDFQLFYASEASEVGLSLLTHRTPQGEKYFLLLASPSVEEKGARKGTAKRDLVFVLDTSGSMAGAKLQQAKRAMRYCIDTLSPGDRFNLMRFSTDTEALFQGLKESNDDTQRDARAFVDGFRASGGTAIRDALLKALELRPKDGERPFMVVFLTDGLPTVGQTDLETIVGDVSRSKGGSGTRIFCFGIGNDVNTHLLDRIAEETRAASEYVLPEEDLEVKLSNFAEKVREPVLSGLKLTFPEGVRISQAYPADIPDLFRGEQLVLAGRYTGEGTGEIRLEGNSDGAKRTFTFDADFPARPADNDFIPRLWAIRRVGYLLDEIRLRGESGELKDEVTELARKYGIVTPYTAYLILEDEGRRGVPLAAQSLPGAADRSSLAYNNAMRAYEGLKRDQSGANAVAAARYGSSQRLAVNVSDALAAGQAEGARGLAAVSTPAPSVAPMPVDSAAAPGAPTKARVGREAKVPAAQAPVAARPEPAQSQLNTVNQYAGGRVFYQNGRTWVDSAIQKLKEPKFTRVKFGSEEYFKLLSRGAEVQGFLALGSQVQFAMGNEVIDVFE